MSLLDIPVEAPERVIPLCATPEQAALLEWAHAHPIEKPRPPVENGRYVLPDTETGVDRKWTRVTTFCDDLENSNFAAWGESLLVRGLTLDAELWAQAQALASDRKALEPIASSAANQGGRWIDADIGTALHTATEHHDLDTGNIPPSPWDAHVAAWVTMLREHGITILTDWMERAVINPAVDCAGTLDRLARLPDGRVVVLDIKTGSGVRKIGYAAQAAIYARATHAWTADGYEPLPDVDTSVALIAHLPAKGEGCEILEVDLARGWAVAEKCHALRTSRSVAGIFTKRDPAAVVTPAVIDPPAQPVPADRSEWIAQRIDTLVLSKAAKAMLADTWPAGMAKRGPWTDEQIDTIAAVLDPIETMVEAPFPHRDPAVIAAEALERAADIATTAAIIKLSRATPDDGTTVPDGDRDALKAAAAKLPKNLAQQCAGWRKEGERHGQPWGAAIDGAWTQRCWSDNRAALLCATHLYEHDGEGETYVRAALSMVLGEPIQPAWATGAVIGALTISEADRLADIAQAASAGDETTWNDLHSNT